MTITEFLQERIAEDRAAVESVVPRRNQRAVDETKAKEQIVRLLAVDANPPDGPVPTAVTTLPGAATAVLQWLASVYADHPDYDKAWRP